MRTWNENESKLVCGLRLEIYFPQLETRSICQIDFDESLEAGKQRLKMKGYKSQQFLLVSWEAWRVSRCFQSSRYTIFMGNTRNIDDIVNFEQWCAILLSCFAIGHAIPWRQAAEELSRSWYIFPTTMNNKFAVGWFQIKYRRFSQCRIELIEFPMLSQFHWSIILNKYFVIFSLSLCNKIFKQFLSRKEVWLTC